MAASWSHQVGPMYGNAPEYTEQQDGTRSQKPLETNLVDSLCEFHEFSSCNCLLSILQIRDRQTSLSVGTPMVINDLDCDAEELTVDDFPNDSEETILYIMTQATLSRAGKADLTSTARDSMLNKF